MSVRIEADVSEAVKLVGDLDDAAEALAVGVSRAVNTTASKVRTDSVRLVTSQVNLPERYVDDRLEIAQEATPDNPVAIIAAPIRGTRFDRYGAKLSVENNTWTKAKYVAKFGSEFARVKLPNKPTPTVWIERKGDRLRNIQKGQKAAGVRVAIVAGGNVKSLPHAFVIKFRAGSVEGGNGMGVMLRGKDGRVRAAYGPSVDQVVRGVWRDIEGDVAAELSQEILTEVSVEVEQRLK